MSGATYLARIAPSQRIIFHSSVFYVGLDFVIESDDWASNFNCDVRRVLYMLGTFLRDHCLRGVQSKLRV